MVRKASNIVLGTLVLLNLSLFGLFVGVEPLSSEEFDCQSVTCCECVNLGAGLPSICMDVYDCFYIQCRDHEDCD